MQKRMRTAIWIDGLSLCAAAFAVSFLWFRSRQLPIELCAALAALLTLLLLCASVLFRKRYQALSSGNNTKQRAISALLMLPHAEALDAAARALSARFDLILPQRAQNHGFVLAYSKTGTCLAVDLLQDPFGADRRSVHAFHRSRGRLAGVLLCTAKPDQDAAAYAETLSPPLRLLEVSALPLDLTADTPAEPAVKKKRRTASALLRAGRAQAVRCMFFSFFMTVLYLVTEKWGILLPTLALQFFALLCKAHPEEISLF